jgi:fatty acid synthase subunit alpha
VGGTALFIHPRYLFGSLEPSAYEAYKSRNHIRTLQSYKARSEMMITNSLVKIKEAPPYRTDMERRVLMNSMPRATLDPKTGSYSFPEKLETKVAVDSANVKAVAEMSHILAEAGSAAGVGLDHGELSCIVLLKFPKLI